MTATGAPVEGAWDSRIAAAALLASLLFGTAIVFSNGAYSDPALSAVTLGFLALMAGFGLALLHRRSSPGASRRLFASLVLLGALFMGWCAWTDPNVLALAITDWAVGRQVLLTNLLLLLSYLPFLFLAQPEPQWLRHGRFGLFALLVLVAGMDTLRASPVPPIDVWTVQQSGAKALSEGLNPFREVAVRDTGPRDAADVPYVYPPMQLYATLPAYVLTGDTRVTMILSLIVTGLALRFIVRRARRPLPSLLEDAPALFLWLSPKLYFVVQQAWVDPVQLMWITLATAAHVARRPLLQAVLFGLAFGSKQTMFWLVPLAGVLLRFDRRQWAVALGVAAATVLPFVLLDFGALWHATFAFVNGLPPRPDALTFGNGLAYKYGVHLPPAAAFPLAAATVGFALARLRAQDFALAAAATYAVFFTFNKWAFANYYFLLLGLCCLAAAMALNAPAPQQPAPAAAR